MDIYYEGRIKGASNGYHNRETEFELANGRIFRQDEYLYKYRYQYNPRVKVYRDGSRYYLEINGMNKKVRVKKIR